MAATLPHSRLRSSSDPFVDPHPRQRPPPPPPKSKMPTSVPSRNSSQHDITEAVRDTVVLNPRSKVSRTQTTVPPGAASRPHGKRSQSEDTVDKSPRSTGKSRSKKGSQHADVIDRLDFTGVGPMFHHDGPFDACAPSRNKHRNKAPLHAWVAGPGDLSTPQYGDSAYPSPNAYKAFTNDYPEQPKKKVDAIAEAWGIHEPEPFEEFFAGGGTGKTDGDTPASSIYNGRDSHSTSRSGHTQRRPKGTGDDRRNMAVRRSVVPPPQPIFVGETADLEPGSPPATSPGFPKRSKSIMHRIRKMRDAPNVPVAPDYEQPPPLSPSSPTDPVYNASRPTHRPQNSFLGRFGGSSRPNQAPAERSEPFVYIDTSNNKDLPAPPPVSEPEPIAEESGSQGYFDSQGGGGGSPPPGGLGRKTSLMKKVGRVVRGAK